MMPIYANCYKCQYALAQYPRYQISRRCYSNKAATDAGQTAWQGTLDQMGYMRQDQCILVDGTDMVIGEASKEDCHKFTMKQPNGLLHRAFSVFLFNSENKLLLQQRAGHKITFPSVWTNTCCSHQLTQQSPNELDNDQDVKTGAVHGACAAAVRKLQHELGIPRHQAEQLKFKFLTRLHYCAADGVEGESSSTGAPNGSTANSSQHSQFQSKLESNNNSNSFQQNNKIYYTNVQNNIQQYLQRSGEEFVWGEHEMDYILFVKADVDLKPNPDEISNVKYVSYNQLLDMMKPESGLLWSPWFRIIATKMLGKWWSDLDSTLVSDQFVDGKIHQF